MKRNIIHIQRNHYVAANPGGAWCAGRTVCVSVRVAMGAGSGVKVPPTPCSDTLARCKNPPFIMLCMGGYCGDGNGVNGTLTLCSGPLVRCRLYTCVTSGKK